MFIYFSVRHISVGHAINSTTVDPATGQFADYFQIEIKKDDPEVV